MDRDTIRKIVALTGSYTLSDEDVLKYWPDKAELCVWAGQYLIAVRPIYLGAWGVILTPYVKPATPKGT